MERNAWKIILKFSTTWTSIVAIMIVGILIPLLIPHQTYLLHLMVIILIFSALANSWNILGGYAGQLSLGHALFFGMGAYTTGLLTWYIEYYKTNPWLSIFIGGCISLLIGLGLGTICFRLKGPYFALSTLAATEIVRLVVLYSEFTRGGLGVPIPIPPTVNLLGCQIDFTEKIPYYYISLFLMVIFFACSHALSKSRYGLMLQAIREDEEAASSLGVNVFRLKLLAMAISSYTAGILGSLYAIYIGYIDASMDPGGVLAMFTSIDAVLMCVIGGIGTILGPLVGAIVKVGVGEYLRVTFGMRSGVDIIVLGVIFIFFCLFAPEGIWGTLKSKLKYRKQARGTY